MELTREEMIYLHELLGKLDWHLEEHFFIDSEAKKEIDIHSVSMKLYNKLDREIEK